MGVPKFFRFMSERYPLISQCITSSHIPEFDHLYLDMNGIIHHCSHPNDGDAQFRITEAQIFTGIFNYIDLLFGKIKPRKLFFMAVDGVAPRAKMNQQRSRRFRSAIEAKDLLDRAIARGEEIPKAAPFDSNCITPGTPFMARLSEQLKYYVNKKMTEDADWRDVQVVLSGHEVPGEGEHKIMEYIRLAKAQPNYNPNVRHCLYGLDADLIMLGLLSHDPHFCLLREEVVFGPQRKSKQVAESQNYYLLHLSLLREYLDLEFGSMAHDPDLTFEYDLERIIDDFILLSIFIGNDFVPHLPNLHINEGAFDSLFKIYKRVLPAAGGYLNEHGKINLPRLQLILKELTDKEKEKFREDNEDASWTAGKKNDQPRRKQGNKLVLTPTQRTLFDQVSEFVLSNLSNPDAGASRTSPSLTFPAKYSAKDRRFLSDLVEKLHLTIAFDEFDENDENVIAIRIPAEMLESLADELAGSGSEAEEQPVVSESMMAIERVLRQYEEAVVEQDTPEAAKEHYEQVFTRKFDTWKRHYYNDKLDISYDDPEQMKKIATDYIAALQWVLHYYYDGVASWSWFYPHHYAPMVSDLTNVADMDLQFDLSKPFKPYQQLMGVMPSLSAQHLPEPFRELMTDLESPIKDFYPTQFESDLNGKKADWEAVVKIPFIDEKRLIQAMDSRERRLTEEERKRNTFGDSWSFTFTTNGVPYPSSLPGVFPMLPFSYANTKPFNLPTLDGLRLVKGLCEGVLLGKDAVAGFPSLNTLPHTAQLAFHAIHVFNSDSRNETQVVTIGERYAGMEPEDIARALMGKSVYTGWPYLREAKVCGVSDSENSYQLDSFNGTERIKATSHPANVASEWRRAVNRIEYQYSKRFGVIVGETDILLTVRPLLGMKRLDDGSVVKEYAEETTDHVLQVVVEDVASPDTRYLEKPAMPVREDFPEGSKVFFLGGPAYGSPAQIIGYGNDDSVAIRVAFFPSDKTESILFQSAISKGSRDAYYLPRDICRRVGMSAYALSRITSSFLVSSKGGKRADIGLGLKYEAKSMRVPGYAKRTEAGWTYSEKAISLLAEYKALFPEVINSIDSKKGQDLREAVDVFPPDVADKRLQELTTWSKEKGVTDFAPVSIYSDQLDKETIGLLEKQADQLHNAKTAQNMKQAIIQNIPRHALLKPSHASTRLQRQKFKPGDRVVMVQDSGNVPLSAKGTVIGVDKENIDVVFDIGFIGGTNLNGRCSQFRGMTVAESAILNLSQQQYVTLTRNQQLESPAPTSGRPAPGRRLMRQGRPGYPSIVPSSGAPAAGFIPAPTGPKAAASTATSALPRQPSRGIASRGGPPQRSFVSAATGQNVPPPQQQPSHSENLQHILDGGLGPRGRHFVPGAYSAVPPPTGLNGAARSPRGTGTGGRGMIHRGLGSRTAGPVTNGHAPVANGHAVAPPAFQPPQGLVAPNGPATGPPTGPRGGGGGRGRGGRGRRGGIGHQQQPGPPAAA